MLWAPIIAGGILTFVLYKKHENKKLEKWRNEETECQLCKKKIKRADSKVYWNSKEDPILYNATELAKGSLGLRSVDGDLCLECVDKLNKEFKRFLSLAQNYHKVQHFSLNYKGAVEHDIASRMYLHSNVYSNKVDALIELKKIAAMNKCDTLLDVDYECKHECIEELNGYIRNQYNWRCIACAVKTQ